MNRLYLVRHGENLANLTKEFSYRKVDYHLTAKGRLQAEQTGDFFHHKDIRAIYTSPLKRAVETAEIIAASLDLPVVILENLREVNVGDLEGASDLQAAWRLHGQVIEDWWEGRATTAFPNGEDLITLSSRLRMAVEEANSDYPDGDLLLVAHGGIYTFGLPEICPDVTLASLRTAYSHNCAITEIIMEKETERLVGRLVNWASCAHLHGLAAELVTGIPDPGMLGPRS